VDLIALLIPNAAVLFLPAWFQLGKDGPRGFETTGQQLILMFGQLLVLALSLLPAAAVFAIIFLLTSHLVPIALGVLLGGVPAAALLLVEGREKRILRLKHRRHPRPHANLLDIVEVSENFLHGPLALSRAGLHFLQGH